MGISVLLLNYLSPVLFYFYKTGNPAKEIISLDFLSKIKKLFKKLNDFFSREKSKDDGLVK